MVKGFSGTAGADFLNLIAGLSLIGLGTSHAHGALGVFSAVGGTGLVLALAMTAVLRFGGSNLSANDISQAKFYRVVGAILFVVCLVLVLCLLLIFSDQAARAELASGVLWPIFGLLLVVFLLAQAASFKGRHDEAQADDSTALWGLKAAMFLTMALAVATAYASIIPIVGYISDRTDLGYVTMVGTLAGLVVWFLLEAVSMSEEVIENDVRHRLTYFKNAVACLGIICLIAVAGIRLNDPSDAVPLFMAGFIIAIIATLIGCFNGVRRTRRRVRHRRAAGAGDDNDVALQNVGS